MQVVADVLNSLDGFMVSSRGIRDRLTTLMKKHKVLMNKEKKLSGIEGTEPTEYDVLIEELIELSEDTDARIVEETTQKKAAEECDKNKALEMRKVAMERFGETRKRKDEDDESPISEKKCRRRTSSDTVAFLREKMEMDKENKKVEKEEREERRKEYQDCIKIFQSQINNQQQQQNALQQQMIAMFSQQTALIKALAEKN